MSEQRGRCRFLLAHRTLDGLLRTRLVSALTTPRSADEFLQLVAPTWSARHVRARVAQVRPEGGDAVSLLLSPNHHWRTFRAGQFVRLSVWSSGVRHTRCFSLSSAPEDGLPLRLTIKAVSGGRVSTWAMRQARRGDIVDLSHPMGDFTLPDPVPSRLLFISGGSGITPITSMIRHLVASGHTGEIACLHYARHEAMFSDELRELARRHPRLRLAIHLTQPLRERRAPSPHLSRERLEALVPDWQEREAFLCGPDPLREAVDSLWRDCGVAQRLHVERFTAPSSPRQGTGAQHRLVFASSGRAVRGNEHASLLEQAEDAGLQASYGCRIGICHRCICIKLSGVVCNELTGRLDDEPHKPIQLCISTPRSDVELDL